ncbi:MAG: helix-turn-helix transcriptional regulator [Pseudomonadota bacterium]
MKKSIHSDKSAQLQELLIKARINSGLTQKQLADKLGKPQSFVAKYEGGERRIDVIEFIEVCQLIGAKAQDIIKKIL